jgi:hypothetical protein
MILNDRNKKSLKALIESGLATCVIIITFDQNLNKKSQIILLAILDTIQVSHLW